MCYSFEAVFKAVIKMTVDLAINDVSRDKFFQSWHVMRLFLVDWSYQQVRRYLPAVRHGAPRDGELGEQSPPCTWGKTFLVYDEYDN